MLGNGGIDTENNVADQENAGPSPAKKKRTKTTEIQLENAPQDEVDAKNTKLNNIHYVFPIRCILYYTRRGRKSEGHLRSHKGDRLIRRKGSQKWTSWAAGTGKNKIPNGNYNSRTGSYKQKPKNAQGRHPSETMEQLDGALERRTHSCSD